MSANTGSTTTMDAWYRSLIVIELEAACRRLRAGPLSKMEWEMVKTGLLSSLNTVDRALDYGSPGAGIDSLFGSKDQREETRRQAFEEALDIVREECERRSDCMPRDISLAVEDRLRALSPHEECTND